MEMMAGGVEEDHHGEYLMICTSLSKGMKCMTEYCNGYGICYNSFCKMTKFSWMAMDLLTNLERLSLMEETNLELLYVGEHKVSVTLLFITNFGMSIKS